MGPLPCTLLHGWTEMREAVYTTCLEVFIFDTTNGACVGTVSALLRSYSVGPVRTSVVPRHDKRHAPWRTGCVRSLCVRTKKSGRRAAVSAHPTGQVLRRLLQRVRRSRRERGVPGADPECVSRPGGQRRGDAA